MDTEQLEESMPTIGFSVSEIKWKKHLLTLYDLGGAITFRGIWEHYFAEIHGLIYVLDTSDEDMNDVGIDVLATILQDPRLQSKPLVM
jgi:signal recognition particle receptor subunit beta